MDRLSTNGQMLSQIDLHNAPHSSFDLRNHNFLSGKLGKLIVSRVDEVYPGDRLVGNIQTVVNFEPLAAPLMGSMVLKQESFYVPWSVVWRHAHDFYTGKNGFNTPMPSVSPRDIYNAYQNVGVEPGNTLPILSEFVADFWDLVDSYSDFEGEDWKADFIGKFELLLATHFLAPMQRLSGFAANHEAVDLVSPIVNEVNTKIFGGDQYLGLQRDVIEEIEQFVSNAVTLRLLPHQELVIDTSSAYFYTLFNRLLSVLEFEYNFIFGISSHLDYMGWPIMDDWHNYFFGDSRSGKLGSKDSYIRLFNKSYYTANSETFPMDENLFSEMPLNWLYFRAFYAIWYWNYRDELLETAAMNPETDEFMGDSVSDLEMVLCTLMRVRCWYKDTFTTALTNTGDGNLIVPSIDGDQSLVSNNLQLYYYDNENQLADVKNYEDALAAGANLCRIGTPSGLFYDVPMNYLSGSFFNYSEGDTDSSIGFSLAMLDRVSRLRRFIMKKLILGYEYDDVIWSNFMVKLSNVRMRIPELLSRGRDAVQINTIVNNTNTAEQIAGDKSAVAWCNGNASGVNYFAEEHGCYISIMTVLPVQSYTGGMARHWSKLKPFDFAWPDFATMGMDAVYNFELSAPRGAFTESGLDDATATMVFGYQGRYYDLKSKLDEQHGRLRTDLQYLTWSREFNMENLPKLNYIFVHCWPNVNPFVVGENEDVFRADVSHNLDFQRRLPVPSEIV